MSLSTHVLDAVTGVPAAAVDVTLSDAGGTVLARGSTDVDGRIQALGDELTDGVYRITFATGAYFMKIGVGSFYPEVVVTFEITDATSHHHVPLLLSPYAYSTYRGS